MKSQHPLRVLCASLEVSSSGYYDWVRRRSCPSSRTVEEARLRQKIATIYHAHRQTYGSPRIEKELRRHGARHGRNRIARLMRQQDLYARQKACFRARTTDSNHPHPIAPNLLASQPRASGPNQIWVGDITYIHTVQGWLYLAAVMDLYSRRIVGWAMSPRLDTTLVLGAWQMAQTHRSASQPLLFHSDRGVQYASLQYRHALQRAQATASMSRKANCYDNAAMESFWSTLKLELVYRENFSTHHQARQEIFNYIETFYNPKRLHSALGYCSPIDFENRTN